MTVLSTLTKSQLLLVDKHSQLLMRDTSDPDQPGSKLSDIRQNELEMPVRELLMEKVIARSKYPA